MTTLIIITIIAYVIIKALHHLTYNTNIINNTYQDEPACTETTRAKVREIANRYHASHIAYGNTFIGEDGCTYLQCSVDVDDSDALDFADDLDDEFGDDIDNMDITFNNNTMNNNQQQPPQIIIVNENNGTINGDYHNHHDGHKSNKPSDNAPYADFKEVNDDDPLPTKGEAKDSTNDTNDTPDTPDIITKLLPIFFGKREQAAKFLSDIRIMTPVQICAHVKQLVNDKVISDLSYQKDLWQVLHDHKLYNHTLRNWNGQVK